MIACLYLEDFGIKLPGGIWTAWKTQVAALRAAGVEVVTDPKQSHDILHLYVPFCVRDIWRRFITAKIARSLRIFI